MTTLTMASERDKAREERGASSRLTHQKLLYRVLTTITVSDFVYCCALSTWIAINIINMSFYAIMLTGVMRYIRLVCLIMVAFSELCRMRVTMRSLLSTSVIVLLAVIAWNIEQRTHVDALLFIWGARNRNPRALLFLAALTSALSTIFVIMSARFGIITSFRQIASGGRMREYLGFRYALYPSAALFGITCVACYLSNRKMCLPLSLVLVIANWKVFSATDSRLSFYLGILVTAIVAAQHISKDRLFSSPVFGAIVSISFVLCAMLSLTLTFSYDPTNELMAALNQTLSSRLQFGRIALERYGITLFGMPINADMVGNGLNVLGEKVSGGYFYIDCLYVRILLEGGLVMFVAYLLALTALSFRAWHDRDNRLLAVLMCLALHGMIDNLMMNLFYNPILLLVGVGLSDPFYMHRNSTPSSTVDNSRRLISYSRG